MHSAVDKWSAFWKKTWLLFVIFYRNEKLQLYVLVMEVSSVYSFFAAGADLSESLGLWSKYNDTHVNGQVCLVQRF